MLVWGRGELGGSVVYQARPGVNMSVIFWWRRNQRSIAAIFGKLHKAWARYLDPASGARQSLLFSIEENPTPRDTGVFSIHCCGELLARVSALNLASDDPSPVLSQLPIHSAELRTCSHQGLRFRNISPWLKQQILNELDELRVRV